MIRSFNGKTPKIAASAFISEAAYIVGDVEIGENSSVWPGAVIRGDSGRIVIGNNTALEDGCIIHSSIPADPDMFIGNNVIIAHGAMIHCKQIRDNVLVGINAAVLRNAEIGDYCLISAGCVVVEGMIVPDNSFVVGVPGKIRGKVTEEHKFRLDDAPREYVELGKMYKEEGLEGKRERG